MLKPKVGVVGAGVVGTAVKNLCGPDTVMYDKRAGYCNEKEAINACDVVFVCVPTPMKPNGVCDASIVEEVVAWIDSPLIIIRSTVTPGTTDRLREVHGKSIVFQPEYLGETTAHIYGKSDEREFIVLGGTAEDTSRAADFYKDYYNSMVRIYYCDAKTAELTKYMENAFFAMKVTFVNEFYDIARAHGVDFNVLRETWLADSRISRDHTFVYPNARGFSGKCLPKDTNAIVKSCEDKGYEPTLLKTVLEVNEYFLKLRERNGHTEIPKNAIELSRASPLAAETVIGNS